MKRTSIILLALLVLLASWYLFRKSSTDVKMDELHQERTFRVDDVDGIHKIFIAYRTKKPVLLLRDGKNWLLDGEYEANPYIMEGILDVLANVRVQYEPGPQRSRESFTGTLN